MSLLFSSTADDVWRVRLRHDSQKGSNYINASFVHVSCCKFRSVSIFLINPRRACARVTVLVLCVFSLFWHLAQSGVQTAVSATSARYGHEI